MIRVHRFIGSGKKTIYIYFREDERKEERNIEKFEAENHKIHILL